MRLKAFSKNTQERTTCSQCQLQSLLAYPLYSNVMAMILVVESLIGKGLPVGTALAFLMSVTAVSLPEMIP